MPLTAGDPVVARYELRDPATGVLTDATVAVAVTRPDGTAQAPVAPVRVAAGTYDATWTADVDGLWRWIFTAAGALADVAEGAVYVWPAGAALPWVPTRRQVAKYVPTRTLPADQSGDAPRGDFDDLTDPSGPQADEHIAAAAAWVTAHCGPVAPGLYGSAGEVAAVRAAGMIELAYPGRDAGINTAEQLLEQADKWAAALCEANEDLVPPDDGGDDGDTTGHVLPRWSFPVPVVYGDELVWS